MGTDSTYIYAILNIVWCFGTKRYGLGAIAKWTNNMRGNRNLLCIMRHDRKRHREVSQHDDSQQDSQNGLSHKNTPFDICVVSNLF